MGEGGEKSLGVISRLVNVIFILFFFFSVLDFFSNHALEHLDELCLH